LSHLDNDPSLIPEGFAYQSFPVTTASFPSALAIGAGVEVLPFISMMLKGHSATQTPSRLHFS